MSQPIERRMRCLYDTLLRTNEVFDLKYLEYRTMLFGSTNLGNSANTNMEMAGQIFSDNTFVVTAVRTVLKMPSEALIEEIKDSLMWSLYIGDHPMISGFVDDLVVPFWIPFTIPVRQCFYVSMEFMGDRLNRPESLRHRISQTPGRKIIRFELHGEEVYSLA